MSQTQRQIIRQLYELNPWADHVPGGPASDHVEGWNGNHPPLSRLVGATGAKVVIDLGVWKGQSGITLARAMKDARIDGCRGHDSRALWDKGEHCAYRRGA